MGKNVYRLSSCNKREYIQIEANLKYHLEGNIKKNKLSGIIDGILALSSLKIFISSYEVSFL